MSKKVGDWYCYTGAIHIHTTESDGTKTLEEVVQLGRQVGLDFMMFSDHMGLSNREMGKEGLYGKTLAVVGYEHNDPQDRHHYLLFDSPAVYNEKMTSREYVAAGAADGALGIIAHPDEIRHKLKEYPPYPWHDWSVDGFNGIELWNQMSEWMERLTRFNKMAMSLSPRKSMIGPTARILKQWDDLCQVRKVAGIAAVDAHAFPVRLGPFTVEIFPYKVHFKTLRTYVLLSDPLSDDFATAKGQLFAAIRDCRLFFANVRWGDARGFEFFAETGSDRITCGGRVDSPKGASLIARFPARADIRLIHNGQQILRTNADNFEYGNLEHGVYRVEAHKRGRGWIYSNHIWVAR